MMRTIVLRLAALSLCGLSAAAPARAEAPEASPAERHMERARQAIASTPASPVGYNELALGLARRARETSDSRSARTWRPIRRTSTSLRRP